MADASKSKLMRLDKFVSHATKLSRTKSRALIKGGRVRLNNIPSSNFAATVSDSDSVKLDDEVLKLQGPTYLMLNKPKGYVCSHEDFLHPTVFDLLKQQPSNLSIAGRLDVDTTGLVLISDDGQWLHRVTSPKRQCEKQYRVTVDQPIQSEDIEAFAQGLLLKGETKPTKPARLEIIEPNSDSNYAKVTISEGRYHQVKRMFAACGKKVVRLHRSTIGKLELDNDLIEGGSRILTQEEVGFFR